MEHLQHAPIEAERGRGRAGEAEGVAPARLVWGQMAQVPSRVVAHGTEKRSAAQVTTSAHLWSAGLVREQPSQACGRPATVVMWRLTQASGRPAVESEVHLIVS